MAHINTEIAILISSAEKQILKRKSGLNIAYTPPTDGNWFTLALSTPRQTPPPDGYQIAGVRTAVVQACKNHRTYLLRRTTVDPIVKTNKWNIIRVRCHIHNVI